MAEVHIAKIVEHFGPRRLDSIKPSDVKSWLVKLQADHAPSYVYALHSRLAQVLADAVHDGVLARNPCSRRTAPRTGSQRPYVATTEQIWALHDAMGERYRTGLLLAAFAGLRLAEVCGLRVSDVDFNARCRLTYPAVPGRSVEDGDVTYADPDSLEFGIDAVGTRRRIPKYLGDV
jgi:integrase